MAKKRKNTWLFILLGLVAVALLIAAIFKGKSKPKGTKVTVEKVEKRTIKETVAASGKIYPEQEVKISSDVSGEVVQLYVEEGDSIKTGQILLKVDPDAYQSAVERVASNVDNAKAQLANSRSGVARAEAQVQQSKAQVQQSKAQVSNILAQIKNQKTIHQRNSELFKEGVIAQADYDGSLSSLEALEANLQSAQATLSSSEANVKALEAGKISALEQVKAAEFSVKGAEASLKETKTNLRRTTIYAPMSGIVSQLNIEKGERVVGTAQMTGTEIMRIANLYSMEVQVDVSENDVLRVNLGDEVEIEVDAYLDKKFTGKVTEIANSASNLNALATTDQVTNFVVKVRINPDSYKDLMTKGKKFPFRPGMSASVEINTNTVKDVLCVPIQAVTTREDKTKKEDKTLSEEEKLLEVIFTVEADTATMKEVKTGIQDETYIQVLSGLEGGEEIIIGPYAAISKKLKSGKKVNKVDKDELYGNKKVDKAD